ncbi:hypothetical protein RND71_034209 [Anisodus tanguticus]|uniref:Uncharacterized protein n=1 Tax=Anisodus tanguticus TaxID=243964 RepID=A0AAE1R967_9SOLA|nr:hypothetical protein RND71_034209 [Anisodus tanguticus]
MNNTTDCQIEQPGFVHGMSFVPIYKSSDLGEDDRTSSSSSSSIGRNSTLKPPRMDLPSSCCPVRVRRVGDLILGLSNKSSVGLMGREITKELLRLITNHPLLVTGDNSS